MQPVSTPKTLLTSASGSSSSTGSHTAASTSSVALSTSAPTSASQSVQGIIAERDVNVNQQQLFVMLPNPDYKETKIDETWNLPQPNDAWFVGREKELHQLKESMAKKMEQPLVISAISGLGGIGKTQLAAYYIHHPAQKYEIRLWFHADNASILYDEYVKFCQNLKIISPKQGKEKLKKDDVIIAVNSYLQKHSNYLIVYDNAGPYTEIEDFLPKQGGQLIITTRRQEYQVIAGKDNKIEVDVFSETETLQYFKKVIQKDAKELEAEEKKLKDLAEKLGYLPLALAQAGAYINRKHISIARYLELYEANSKKMLADTSLSAYSKEQKTVAITWETSLKAIIEDEKTDERGVSQSVLRAMSYLHPNQIPLSLLEAWIETKGLAKKSEAKTYLENAVGHLTDYSMIQCNAHKGTLNVHCLVQEVVRLPIEMDTKSESKEQKESKQSTKKSHDNFNAIGYLDALAGCLSKEFVRETKLSEDEDRQKGLLPHMQDIIKHYKKCPPSFLATSEGLALMLVNTGNILWYFQDNAIEARSNYEKAIEIMKKKYPPNYYQITIIQANLAKTYSASEDKSKAISLLEKVVEQKQSWPEKNNFKLSSDLGSLGNLYSEEGKHEKAIDCLTKALALYEQQYGHDDPRTVVALDNLAIAFGSVKDGIKVKRKLLERARTICEVNNMLKHINFAKVLSSLAGIYYELGYREQASSLFEKALEIKRLHYNQDHHPEIIGIKIYLAEIYLSLVHIEKTKFYLDEVLKTLTNSSYSCELDITFFIQAQDLRNRLTYYCQLKDYLCTPTVIELLQQRDFDTAEYYFMACNINLHVSQLIVHKDLADIYRNQQNLLGAITHSEVILNLLVKAKEKDVVKIAHLHCILGSYYYAYAKQLALKEKKEISTESINKVHQFFQEGLKSLPHPGGLVEYANFFLQQGEFTNAIKYLEEALLMIKNPQPSSKEKLFKKEIILTYSKMQCSILDKVLQAEVGFWGEINFKPICLAYYLLIKAYCRQLSLGAAKKHLTEFATLAQEEQDPLIFSLLGASHMLIQDYSGALASYHTAWALKSDYSVAQRNYILLTLRAILPIYARNNTKKTVKDDMKESKQAITTSLLVNTTSQLAPISLTSPPTTCSLQRTSNDLYEEDAVKLLAKQFLEYYGDCGFNVLGTSREELVRLLSEEKARAEYRQLLAPEIRAFWSNEANKPQPLVDLLEIEAKLEDGLKSAKQERKFEIRWPNDLPTPAARVDWLLVQSEIKGLSSKNTLEKLSKAWKDKNEELDTFCRSEQAYEQYLGFFTSKKIWLGYKTALLYAKKQHINLYILHKDEKDGAKLRLDDANKHEEKGSPAVIHMLHTHGFTHFNLLAERSKVAKQAQVPLQSKTGLPDAKATSDDANNTKQTEPPTASHLSAYVTTVTSLTGASAACFWSPTQAASVLSSSSSSSVSFPAAETRASESAISELTQSSLGQVRQ